MALADACAWLSQYPHETEILFAPLAGLEATDMRIDTHPLNGKHIIVVGMRVSINLTNPTIEQVVAKRRKIVDDMGRGLLQEVRSALNKKGSNETEAYVRLLRGLFNERPLRHEATWYNDDTCFQESVTETLRLKREVLNIPTLEARKLEGDAVVQLLGETLRTKAKVPEIPSVLFKEFLRLRVLQLDAFGGIEALPETLGGLSALTTLNLRECEKLMRVPESIGQLKALQQLNMPSCKELSELPTSIGKLEVLSVLDLSFCPALTSLPTEVGQLRALLVLKLEKCVGLTTLPVSLGHLVNLKTLKISGCSALAAIPDQLGELTNLEECNLRGCSGLIKLPDTFGSKLQKLKELDLTMCKAITALPVSLGECETLRSLFLGNCYNLLVLPEEITRLSTLAILNLYNCGKLTKLPDNFHLASSLRVLSLQGCEKLVEVPPSVAMMPALTTLTLWDCRELKIMPDMSQIPKLQLDGVPEQLADWEADQKRKRAEDAAAGRSKMAVKAAEPTGWRSGGPQAAEAAASLPPGAGEDGEPE